MVSDAQYKSTHGEGLNILTPKLAQVKAIDTSENVLNEIRKIILFVCEK